MIQSFTDDETKFVHVAGRSRRWGSIARMAARRLEALDFATTIEDLRNPPGSRLDEFRGVRDGLWSLHIYGQFRICFRWDGNDAWDVQIVDDH